MRDVGCFIPSNRFVDVPFAMIPSFIEEELHKAGIRITGRSVFGTDLEKRIEPPYAWTQEWDGFRIVQRQS